MSFKLNAIAAMGDSNRGIGYQGRLPWSLPFEFKYFLHVIQRVDTPKKRNAIIMGRKSWLDFLHIMPNLPQSLIYVVLSRSVDVSELKDNEKFAKDSLFVAKSYPEAVEFIETNIAELVENVFVCGGSDIYREAFGYRRFDQLFLTHVYGDFECDTFLQPDNFLQCFEAVADVSHIDDYRIGEPYSDEKSDVKFKFMVYRRKELVK